MKKRAFYNYAIEGFQTNENNVAIIDINYGFGKTPLHIFKKDMQMLIKAIISSEEMNERKIERLEGDEVETLTHFLKGRAMILITDFESYDEYGNGIQNGVKEIAGLSIDGKIDRINSFNYETLEPRVEDLNPIK